MTAGNGGGAGDTRPQLTRGQLVEQGAYQRISVSSQASVSLRTGAVPLAGQAQLVRTKAWLAVPKMGQQQGLALRKKVKFALIIS